MLVAGPFLNEIAETRDPDVAVQGGRLHHGVGEAGLSQDIDLAVAEFLAAQVGRIDLVRIDQDCGDASAPERGCDGGSGQSAANDCNIRVPHRRISVAGHSCTGLAGETFSGRSL